jgi:hypothetical protein
MFTMLLCLMLLLPSLSYALTAAQITELETELVTDPQSIGFATFITTGNDSALADAINLVRAGGGYVVSKGLVKRDEFLGTWGDVIDGIRTISDATLKAKWTWRLDKLLLAKDTVDYGGGLAAGFFADMVTDALVGAGGAITSGDVTARTTRQGSRAEVLWGPGTVVTLRDISLALRNSQ